MIDLSRLFINLFYPLESSESSFLLGVDLHISKMQANNPAGYATLISNTISARTNVINARAARGQEDGQQQGSTILMNKAKEDFLKFIRIREGLIKSTFEGVQSVQYAEFFPYGLNELDEATLNDMPAIMTRIINVANIYQAELGAQFVNDCSAKSQAFLDARSAQVTNLGEHSSLQAQTQDALRLLGVQLCINVHTIAMDNIGNSGAADSYFEQRYFQRPEVSGLYTGTNAPNQTKTVRSQGWSDTKNIRIINKGTEIFSIGFANAEGVPVADEPTVQQIPPGETREYTALQMGYAPGNAHLNITARPAGAIWEVLVTD